MSKTCLAMIVKNEEKVIERCLRAAAPFIDTYCIHDTGSTDKTKKIIRKTMSELKLKGVLSNRAWIDYGTNRTEVFDNIRISKMADYALVLDADDIIVGTKPVITTNVGEITIKSEGLEYRQRQLFDMSIEWEYRGKLHEAPYTKHDASITDEIVKDVVINHMSKPTTAEEERNKYEEHVKLALAQDLSDPRNQFYLAQSLKAASRLHEAMIEYKKRIEMKGGWYQEAVYSQLIIARIEHFMGETDRATLDYMKCFEMDPMRGEALMELTVLAKNSNQFNLGKMFSDLLFEIIKKGPDKLKDRIFVESRVYSPAMLLDMGLCEYYATAQNKKAAEKMWKMALRAGTMPDNIKEALKKNMEYVKT